jgi:cell filamentation protein
LFDPFGDFDTRGYLRNEFQEKDLKRVKELEHEMFRGQLAEALDFLHKRKSIAYQDFLKVHEILFGAIYPWAGKDRAAVLPDRAIQKGTIFFAHPLECRLAVEEGLRQAQEKKLIATRPGLVMGLFAYGHPFLDGNGRTMLLVHAELCFRAGMSINWMGTTKNDYLQALSREIERPNDGHLDTYLKPFVSGQVPREAWLASVNDMPGLDGATPQQDVSTSYADPQIAQQYEDFERGRAYRLSTPTPEK